MDPITIGFAGGLLCQAGAKVIGKVLEDKAATITHDMIKRVAASILEAGKLPANHDLRRAALDSLKNAGLVLADAMACELDPKLRTESFGRRFRRRAIASNHWTDGSTAEMAWVQRLVTALNDREKLELFGDAVLQVGADSTGLLDSNVDTALASALHKEFVPWAKRHANTNGLPPFFPAFVLEGWKMDEDGANGGTLTLYQAYCLFFREHIKHDGKVFNIFAGNTLALIQQQLAELKQAPIDPAKFNASLRRELTAHYDRQLGELREYLDSHLSEIKEALNGIAETQQHHTEQHTEMLRMQDELRTLIMERLPPSTRLQDEIKAEFPSHVKALFDEASELVTEGRYADAKAKLEAARQAAESDKCVPAILQARVEIAEAEFFSVGDLNTARDELRTCLREAPENRLPELRQSILMLLGNVECRLADYEAARFTLQESQDLAQKRKDRFAEACVLITLSHVQEILTGDPTLFCKHLNDAERLLRYEQREATGVVLRNAETGLAAVQVAKARLLRREGKSAEEQRCLEIAKSLAEKHELVDFTEKVSISLRQCNEELAAQQPPVRDLATLIRELYEWRSLYPKLTDAILPLWYYLRSPELRSICRSMVGTKFLVSARDSLGFEAVTGLLRGQADLCAWGCHCSLKIERRGRMVRTEPIPMPMWLEIPPHLESMEITTTDYSKARKLFERALDRHEYFLVRNERPYVTWPDTDRAVSGRQKRFDPSIREQMLGSSAEKLISEKKLCFPLTALDRPPSVKVVSGVAWENGMFPVLTEKMPHGGGVKSVCDISVEIPNATAATESIQAVAAAAKELWLKLLAACPTAPQLALADFAKAMGAVVAGLDNEHRMPARVYALRFHAGAQEVIHPAVVLNMRT